MIEEWKDITGYEGIYSISNKGRVRRNEHQSWNGYGWFTLNKIILKNRKHSGGYLNISLRKNRKSKNYYIHRLVLEHFHGICPEEYECRHLDGNKINNHIYNLKWGTHSDNMADKVLHGTALFKENHPNAKLNMNIAREIRILYSTGNYTQKLLQEKYNVGKGTIAAILEKRTWRE